MPSTVILTTGLIAFIFSYLAINLDEEHSNLKLLNLGVSYVTIIVSFFMSMQYLQEEMPGTGLAQISSSMGTYYTYLLVFILGYFVVYIIYKLMQDLNE